MEGTIMATTRWYVEMSDGEFVDVGADSMEIHPSGALVFAIGEEMIAYPHGRWVAVHSEVVH